jgi:ATP-dependent Clp protease ATP-binding subunit ClpC
MPDEGINIGLFCASLEKELSFKQLGSSSIETLLRHRERIVYFTDYAKLVVYATLGKETADKIWQEKQYPVTGGTHTLFELYWVSTVINPEISWELKTNVVERDSQPKRKPITETSQESLEPLRNRLPKIESFLQTHVMGQGVAVETVLDVLYRTAAGLNEDDRPQAVLLFTGPSGVGKSHLAKVLSVALFEDKPSPDRISNPSAYFRIDCTLYQQKHEISNLIGSPQGYVGSDLGSPLPMFIKEHPEGCVILIDEVEKAHPSLHKMFMGLFDYGRIKDNKQIEIDASNVIFIMTSNAGSQEASFDMERAQRPLGFAEPRLEDMSKTTRGAYKRSLEKLFPPEILGRIDDMVIFQHLDEKASKGVLGLELDRLDRKLHNKGISLKVTAGAKQSLIRDSMSAQTGARQLSSHIREALIKPLSRMIVTSDCDSYICRSRDGKVIVEANK